MQETSNIKSEAFTNIESRWLDTPHLSDLNPVSMGWHARGRGGSFGPGVRDVYIFQYVISGKGIYSVKGNTYHVKKGDLFLIRPNEVMFYQADFYDPYTYVFMDFNGNMVDDLLKFVGLDEKTYVQSVPELYNIFNFIKVNTTSSIVPNLEFCVKLYEIFNVLYSKNIGISSKGTIPEHHVRTVINYIHTNYMQDIHINTISDHLGLDRRYLSRIFTQYLGVSPQKYLIDYRMEKARLLLKNQNMSVNETSRSVGYGDPLNFSKMYKKKFGVSPSEEVHTSKKQPL